MKVQKWLLFSSAGLASLLACKLNAQAQFSGNVREINNKKGVSNVKIMVVTANDTTYHTPDIHGDFKFSNTAGKTKIYAISDGYVSEINSVNTTNGSKNTVNISMVPAAKYDASTAKRAEWGTVHTDKYLQAIKTLNRKPCALPGIKPISQSYGSRVGGVLMASEVNDFAKWEFLNEINNTSYKAAKQQWKFVLDTRVPVQLKLKNNAPVVDAMVEIINESGAALWTARTDNTGKAELWPDAFGMQPPNAKYSIRAYFGNDTFSFDLLSQINMIQTFELDKPCAISDNLDIAFVVDATGSMSDEITYIKNDLDTFIKQVATENKDINIRLGSVFYRDNGDEYLAKYSPFSSNSHITDNFILDQVANGGGDYPEAVTSALEFGCDSLEWSENARARLMFLILDAGAHTDEMSKNKIAKYTAIAAQKGIRIIPIICSGLTPADEALMRSLAIATNGTNIYLSSNATVGNSFVAPSADHYKIETLSELLSRITRQFSLVPECDNKINNTVLNTTDSLLYTANPNGENDTSYAHIKNAEWQHHSDTNTRSDSNTVIQNTSIQHSFVTIFPNPTTGPLGIKTSADIKIMYLADVTGKILQPVKIQPEGITTLQMDQYASGIYYLKYPTTRGWGAERFILQKI